MYVSESGIAGPEDVEKLRENGVDGVLVGETLMRARDKRAALDRLRGCGLAERDPHGAGNETK